MLITIDGYAATGKSTITRLLGQRLGIPAFSSGLLYRAVAMLLLPRIGEKNEVRDSDISYAQGRQYRLAEGGSGLFIDEVYYETELRSRAVTNIVAHVSADARVRAIINRLLLDLTTVYSSFVIEGRDMGTVVFPGADYKFFFESKLKVRLEAIGGDLSASEKEELEEGLKLRDERDSNRTNAPLRVDSRAVRVDPFARGIDKTVADMEAIVLEKWSAPCGPDNVFNGQLLEIESMTGNAIVILNKPSFENLPALANAGAAVFRDHPMHTSHAFMLFREYCIPYIVGAGEKFEPFIAQNISLVCDKGVGRIYPDSMTVNLPVKESTVSHCVLNSTEKGMSHNSRQGAKVCATRGEFMLLQHISKHPLAILESSAEKTALQGSLKRMLLFGSSHFDELIYRLSDFSSDNLNHLELFGLYDKQESNPVLGDRGAYRLLNKHNQLLDLELGVVAELHRGGITNISLLIPYVRSPNEAATMVGRVREQFQGAIGSMIEVPAMIWQAVQYEGLFDYLVIGCSDCLQLLGGASRELFPLGDGHAQQFLVEILQRYLLPQITPNKRVFITSKSVYNDLRLHNLQSNLLYLG